MRRNSWAIAAAGVLTAILASGCASQISGLAPVGGDDVTGLRIAAIDVLLEQKLTIRDAPVCTDTGEGYTCVGSLTDGSEIVVTSPDPDATTMTVMVRDITVYDGSVQDVLDRAAGIE